MSIIRSSDDKRMSISMSMNTGVMRLGLPMSLSIFVHYPFCTDTSSRPAPPTMFQILPLSPPLLSLVPDTLGRISVGIEKALT